MSLKIIKNKNLFLKISPDMGASIINFKTVNKNLQIFRPFNIDKKISKYNSYFSGYFATVPYFGPITNKSFFCSNKNQYISLRKNHILEQDTIHGEGWITKWHIKKHTKNSIDLFFIHSGKNGFPYPYKVIQKFKLIKNSLIISISIQNLSSLIFDCGIGFHPWFNISKDTKIYLDKFTYLRKKDSKNFKKFKLSNAKFLNLNKYKIDKTFLDWNGVSKLIINNDLSIKIKNNKNINNLHVYSPPNENFFCIEPVTNIADAYYLKKIGKNCHGLISLAPNKKFKAICEFEIEV